MFFPELSSIPVYLSKKLHKNSAGGYMILKSIRIPLSLLLLLSSVFVYADSNELKVPYYSQGKESPWAAEKLGNKSSVTIRTHGCALTCISMVFSYYSKKELTPSVMNKWLQEQKAYEAGWDGKKFLGNIVLNWPSLAKYEPGWIYTRMDWKASKADVVLIQYYLSRGIPVIAEVLYKKEPHYVVLTGYNKDGFIMNDPEFPDEHVFNTLYNIDDKWGKGPARNIFGIRVLYPVTLKTELK
jgi:hypothetical protein